MQVLRNKYKINGVFSVSIARSNCSFIWRSLITVWTNVITNVYQSIGDGQLVNFWNDIWVWQIGPLQGFYTGHD